MGVVYAARDRRLGRPAAIKALRPERAKLTRLLAEAAAMARLAHPNVVAVYDVIERGDGLYLAMELVQGRNLRQWLGEQPRSWRDVIDVFVEAGEGPRGGARRRPRPPRRQTEQPPAWRRRPRPAWPTSDSRSRPIAMTAPSARPTRSGPRRTWPRAAARRANRRAQRPVRVLRCAPRSLARRPAGRPVRARAVPRQIRRAVERGLRADPNARFSSMRTLVAALRAGRRSIRRRSGPLPASRHAREA